MAQQLVDGPTGPKVDAGRVLQPTRLDPTPIPGVFRLRGGDVFGLDLANLKNQRARDGLVSYQDALVRGIPRSEWETAIGATSSRARAAAVTTLFLAHPLPNVAVLRRMDGGELKTTPSRAVVLRKALDEARAAIERARGRGARVVYPELVGGSWTAGSPARPREYHVDLDQFAALQPTGEELSWLLDELCQKRVRVTIGRGASHYMTSAMKAALDARILEIYGKIEAARASRPPKRVIYVSTFISSVDPKINREIAKFVEHKLLADPQWGNVYVVNPTDYQGIPDATGDDYIYVWEQLIGLNVFDAVRFTSALDTKAFFASKQSPVPPDYLFTYGDAMHSAGVRYEWNAFARVNRRLVEQGQAHLVVPFFHGDEAVQMSQLTLDVDTVDYRVRGEILE